MNSVQLNDLFDRQTKVDILKLTLTETSTLLCKQSRTLLIAKNANNQLCKMTFVKDDMALSSSLCCLPVNNFRFSPIFSKLCIALFRLVLAASIITASFTLCLFTVVAERALCSLDVAHLVIHQLPLSLL